MLRIISLSLLLLSSISSVSCQVASDVHVPDVAEGETPSVPPELIEVGLNCNLD